MSAGGESDEIVAEIDKTPPGKQPRAHRLRTVGTDRAGASVRRWRWLPLRAMSRDDELSSRKKDATQRSARGLVQLDREALSNEFLGERTGLRTERLPLPAGELGAAFLAKAHFGCVRRCDQATQSRSVAEDMVSKRHKET